MTTRWPFIFVLEKLGKAKKGSLKAEAAVLTTKGSFLIFCERKTEFPQLPFFFCSRKWLQRKKSADEENFFSLSHTYTEGIFLFLLPGRIFLLLFFPKKPTN